MSDSTRVRWGVSRGWKRVRGNYVEWASVIEDRPIGPGETLRRFMDGLTHAEAERFVAEHNSHDDLLADVQEGAA